MVQWAHSLGLDLGPASAVYAFCCLYMFSAVTAIWVIGLLQGNHSMMDGFYGFGFASVGWIAYIATEPVAANAAVLLLMVSLHGGRLGYYLSRRWYGYRETSGGDKRYLGFVQQLAPGYWWKSFFVVMQPQTIVIMVISLPVIYGIATATGPARSLGLVEAAGMLVFGIGLYFEWLADGQLQAFKADPLHKGRYLEHGVWALSRHPNYFGNVCVWWGIWIVAAAGNHDLWWTVAGPIFNTVMLTKVLGTAFQDKFMGERPEYQALMQKRSGFLPIARKAK